MTDQEITQLMDSAVSKAVTAAVAAVQQLQANPAPAATSSTESASLAQSLEAKLAEVQALEEKLAALNDPNYALKRDIARVADLKSFIAIANATRRGTIRGEEMLARQKAFHFSPYLR